MLAIRNSEMLAVIISEILAITLFLLADNYSVSKCWQPYFAEMLAIELSETLAISIIRIPGADDNYNYNSWRRRQSS